MAGLHIITGVAPRKIHCISTSACASHVASHGTVEAAAHVIGVQKGSSFADLALLTVAELCCAAVPS